MGNTNVKSINANFTRRPHSVIGLRSEEWFLPHEKNLMARTSGNVKLNKANGKALLPPIPRSHSFHQILRLTENGVNLLQKGTIRGVEGKGICKDVPISNEDVLNPELNAILKARRCRSEVDLINKKPNSFSSQEDKFSFDGCHEKSEVRKGLSNGVAARIQKFKYRAPQPPIFENSVPSFVNLNSNSIEGKKLSEEKTSSQKNTTKLSEVSYKTGLIRKLSEKSHLVKKVKASSNKSFKGNPLLLPRLKLPKGFKNNQNGYIKEKSKEISKETCTSFHEFNDFISQEMTNRLKNNVIDLDKAQLNDSKNLSNFSRRDFNRNSIKFSSIDKNKFKTNKLPPVFDDNFILRRVTPNAGLNGRNESGFNSPTRSALKSLNLLLFESDLNKRKSNNHSNELQLSPFFNNQPNSNSKSKSYNQKVSKSEKNCFSFSINSQELKQDEFKLNTHDQVDNYEQLVHIGRFNQSCINDSANCSEENGDDEDENDDDEENNDNVNNNDDDDDAQEKEEIKVVLRPFLPPHRKRSFSTNRNLILNNLFTNEFNPVIKVDRKQCWTPMEDLTSSKDDDGINCDLHSEDSEFEKKNVRHLIQSYNTRFTFQNQLRTLFHNNKFRAHA